MPFVNRMDALLSVVSACKGQDCHMPWKSLHPDGSVLDLKTAMDPQFDTLYENITRFTVLITNRWVDLNDEDSFYLSMLRGGPMFS